MFMLPFFIISYLRIAVRRIRLSYPVLAAHFLRAARRVRLGLFDVVGSYADEAFDCTIAPLPPELARFGFVRSMRTILYARHPHLLPASVDVLLLHSAHVCLVT